MDMYFGGVKNPSFLQITSVSYSVLPPISQNTQKVPGMEGEIDFGNNINPRIVTVGLLIETDGVNPMSYYTELVADWLYSEEAKQLIFSESEHEYVMAKITGNSDIDEFMTLGTGEVTFYCSNPHKYGVEKTYNFVQSGDTPVNFRNSGNRDAFPTLEMTFTKNVTEFIISDSNNNSLVFGKPLDLSQDSEEDDAPELLFDNFSTYSGWSSAASVDNGAITGSFASDGYVIKQANADYGAGSLWHGAAAEKSIGGEVQDFMAWTKFYFKSTNKNQFGRIEMYLLDVNGAKVAKVSLRDATSGGDSAYFEGIVGSGTKIVGTYGNKQHNQFAQMSVGFMMIKRIGKKYEFYISHLDSKGKHSKIYSKVWYDSKNQYQAKIAKVRLHVGAWNTAPALNSLSFTELKIQEYKTLASNKVPYAFKTNDVLQINCATGEIRKNGEVFYTTLNPISKFIRLKKGINSIVVSDSTAIMNATISIKERWL